jgi:hypothetical protein
MRHSLKAVFNRRSDAQHVLDELLACGYSRTDTEISNAEGLAASVRHRLARLIAARLHKPTTEGVGASMSGQHVVTLTADSEPDAERAMHIIQRFHPAGVEDLPGEWDHDTTGTIPAACPPGTEPGALQYRSRGSSPYFGTQSADSPPMGNTFEEPMYDDQLRTRMAAWWTEAGAGAGIHDNGMAAYRYGKQMRASDKYRNRSWDEVEPDLQSGWDARPGGAPAWASCSAAIRQGWDSVSPDIDEDAYYRTHWNAHYGSRAGSGSGDYDQHAPAYLFGSEARRSEKYRSHDWENAEPHLKSDWEARHPGQLSPWENFKDAVKHGWNRIHTDTDGRTP